MAKSLRNILPSCGKARARIWTVTSGASRESLTDSNREVMKMRLFVTYFSGRHATSKKVNAMQFSKFIFLFF